MKYTIYINQLAYHRMGLCGKLDITDLAILDYIHGWCVAPRADRIIIDHQEYTRINYTHLIEEMPILRIREKDTISARIKKLRAHDLIRTFQRKDKTLYVRQTQKCYSIFFSDDNSYYPGRKRPTYPKKPDRVSELSGQALSEKFGQQQTYNYNNPKITTTESVVVSEIETKKVRDILSTINISYEGITDRLISDLITEKGFSHVFETARKIAKQYHPGSQPISNPAGHFKFLVMEGMEAPKGYTSKEEEEDQRKHEKAKRKEKNHTQEDGPSLEEVRNFVNQLRIGGTKDIPKIGSKTPPRGES
ncbi:MAG: hypothetical protein AB1552_10895 [Nitrospirota bacterium]